MAHGPSVPAGARAVSSHVTQRPLVHTWHTVRQSPVGPRTVSPRVSPGSSGSWPIGCRFSAFLDRWVVVSCVWAVTSESLCAGRGGVWSGRHPVYGVLVHMVSGCFVRAGDRGVSVLVTWPVGSVSAAARGRVRIRPEGRLARPVRVCLVGPPSGGRSSTQTRAALAGTLPAPDPSPCLRLKAPSTGHKVERGVAVPHVRVREGVRLLGS